MSLKNQFIDLLQYNNWANTNCLKGIQKAKFPDNYLPLFSHILIAQEIWLSRIIGTSPAIDVWQVFSLDECLNKHEQIQKDWEKFLSDSSDEMLTKAINYQNTKGKSFEEKVQVIITHVVNHSTHHRAQISLKLRQDKEVPNASDYIFYKRL